MGRWLPKQEREKRDRKVVELYQSGLAYAAIVQRCGLSGDGDIRSILKRYGVQLNRLKKEV